MARETIAYIIPASLDDIPDGSTYAKVTITEASRLAGCDENAEVNPTGIQMQSTILALADADRVLIGSEPGVGEKKVYSVHINSSGNIATEQDTVAES